jgi:hypothetical protein
MSPGSSPSARAHCWRPRFARCRSSQTCCLSTRRGAITHAAPVSRFILARSSSGRPLASPTDPCWLVGSARRRSQAHGVRWCSAKKRSAAGCGHVSARDHWLCTRPGGPTSTPPAPSCSPLCIACERPSPCGRHAASRDALGRVCRPGPTASSTCDDTQLLCEPAVPLASHARRTTGVTRCPHRRASHRGCRSGLRALSGAPHAWRLGRDLDCCPNERS